MSLPAINPLFLGLLIAGLLLVIGVVLMNWLQERRVRRRIDAAFRKPAGDRVEPQFNDAVDSPAEATVVGDAATEPPDDVQWLPDKAEVESAAATAASMSSPSRAERGALAPDPDIECVIALQPAQPVATQALAGALAAHAAKPARWLARRGAGLPWQSLDGGAAGPWTEIVACMLLANRAGAASRSDIEAFAQAVASAAAALHAGYELPNTGAEAARGEELDRFCADLDVQIGLTLLKGGGGQITGTRLRGIAEAAGFKLGASGQFEYMQDDTGAMLYALQHYKQEPFTIEGLRAAGTPGVTLLLDVPRVAEPVRAFDQMRLAAKRMAQSLEATLVDDNHRALNDASLSAIRTQVQVTAEALRAANIEPGGPRALRLFG
ncbi:MAG: cell division protein ZipA C-terminal FtsZ-binding domain-containing protein [Betaproteobacteria bacterium]